MDPQNGYRYYSLRNLWQLDIITTCRKLNIPLDTVRQILSLQDNAEIVRLLMEYREEALRRSAYYQQVAEDILWYKEEHRRIEAQKDDPPLVRQVWREAEQVIAGRAAQGGSQAYHVNMQQAAQAELQQAASIRRRYGYLLDGAGMPAGRVRLHLCAGIYRSGLAPIAMQSLNTLYIVGLNLILKQFTEDAVTVLGLYYKLQTFFFIPLTGLQQVIVPVVSFNHSAGAEDRVRETLRWAVGISEAVMAAATTVFLLAPQALLRIFSASPSILATGAPALRIICLSFLPAGIAMTLTVFFQGSGQSRQSIFIIVLRQVVLLVPLAWVFHFAGLTYVWLTFPVTEVLSVLCALAFYRGAPFLSKRRNAE